jgi:hypothetical protein
MFQKHFNPEYAIVSANVISNKLCLGSLSLAVILKTNLLAGVNDYDQPAI